jgi:DNA polymerase-3 subunit delta'
VTAFDVLVGQQRAAEALEAAVADAARIVAGGQGPAMTHAWLLVGPPGSGRSVAARAFAQALQCEAGGCGACASCRDAGIGTHPDITMVESVGAFYAVDDVRALVAASSAPPLRGRWRVIVVEDADRLAAQAGDWRSANALLKAIEEPADRTVWVLCAPSVQDVLPTIRSRCRTVTLRTPSTAEVAAVLEQRFGADPSMAAFAARASQGHIGRARRFIRDEEARRRRSEVLDLPARLIDLDSCMTAAANLVEAADDESKDSVEERHAHERDDVRRVYGVGGTGMQAKGASKALKDLKKQQERRTKRVKSDVVDLALQDLLAFYRDVLVLQTGARVALVNEERRPDLERFAASSSPETTVRRMNEIVRTREVLISNAQPRLVLEAMFLTLRDPSIAAASA